MQARLLVPALVHQGCFWRRRQNWHHREAARQPWFQEEWQFAEVGAIRVLRDSKILFKLMDRLRAEGKGCLFVSHRMDEIFRLCDSLTVLRDGKLAAHHPSLEGITRDGIVCKKLGREIVAVWGWHGRSLGEVRLEVDHISGATEGLGISRGLWVWQLFTHWRPAPNLSVSRSGRRLGNHAS